MCLDVVPRRQGSWLHRNQSLHGAAAL